MKREERSGRKSKLQTNEKLFCLVKGGGQTTGRSEACREEGDYEDW